MASVRGSKISSSVQPKPEDYDYDLDGALSTQLETKALWILVDEAVIDELVAGGFDPAGSLHAAEQNTCHRRPGRLGMRHGLRLRQDGGHLPGVVGPRAAAVDVRPPRRGRADQQRRRADRAPWGALAEDQWRH